MRKATLSGIVKRRFVHCINQHARSVPDLVAEIKLPPLQLCKLIAGQQLDELPLMVFYRAAQWLQMPLANALALAGRRPTLSELVRLGMHVQGYNPTSAADQLQAAQKAGVSVAVFRRALHGYADFRPSIRTCDRLAQWLSWTGLRSEDIAVAAGMVVRYLSEGRRVTISPENARQIGPYPCACGRAGCMVPAHVPQGRRRKWRSDACRMWAKRRAQRSVEAGALTTPPLPHREPIVRFIRIKERPVPVRF